jgi:hypothetical protein
MGRDANDAYATAVGMSLCESVSGYGGGCRPVARKRKKRKTRGRVVVGKKSSPCQSASFRFDRDAEKGEKDLGGLVF